MSVQESEARLFLSEQMSESRYRDILKRDFRNVGWSASDAETMVNNYTRQDVMAIAQRIVSGG